MQRIEGVFQHIHHVPSRHVRATLDQGLKQRFHRMAEITNRGDTRHSGTTL